MFVVRKKFLSRPLRKFKLFFSLPPGLERQWLSKHCVKSVQIRNYFWSVFSCIRTEYRKILTRNNSVFGHFSRIEGTIRIVYSYKKPGEACTGKTCCHNYHQNRDFEIKLINRRFEDHTKHLWWSFFAKIVDG